MKSNVNILSGSITKGLLSMSIPIMIMNVTQVLFNTIDMTILGKFANDDAVGAVGVTGVLVTLCTSLLIGIATGSNVIVAKRIGQNKKDLVEKAVGTSLLLSVTGGLLLLLIGVLFAETFLKMTNCPESLLSQAVLYFKLYFWGIPMLMVYNFCAAILRAAGDTKRPMYYLIISGIIKVVFSITFVAFFKMDVDGVGYATIISNIVVGALSFNALLKSKDDIRFNPKRLRFYWSELKNILFIGVPTGLQSALYSFANTVITTAVNGFGAAATTGLSIANQFDGILYHIACAPSLAATPFIAQNLGAKNIERTKKAIKISILIATGFGASFGFASAIFSRQLSSLMSTTPEIIMYSQQKMIIISSTYFICGINEIMGGVLRGLGKPIIPTISTFIFMCLIRFPWVYFVFPFCPNLTFLYLIWPIGWILSIITQTIAYIPAIKKLQKSLTDKTEKSDVLV